MTNNNNNNRRFITEIQQTVRYARENEKKGRKICIATCAILSLIISVTFSILFWSRMLIAADYDQVIQTTVQDWGTKSAYDTCPGAQINQDPTVAESLGFIDSELTSDQVNEALK